MSHEKNNPEIILGITGSIAAYKALNLLRLMVKKNLSVNVILTKEAQEFVTPLSCQSISKNKVYTELFERIENYNPLHISLSSRSSVNIIYPATANFISKIAIGLCDDLLSCVIFSSKSSTIFCPAMEENMYLHPVIQDNIKKLKNLGYLFLGPKEGELISGKRGIGHIIDEKEVLDKIGEILKLK